MNPPDSGIRISCRNVWKLYGPAPMEFLREAGMAPDSETLRAAGYIPAVRDASFDVRKAECLVVMGLSGSGKSTLVRCLTRLIEPTAGEIEIDGENLLDAGPRALIEIRRHKMGMVFQHFALLPHRTVLENVAFPLEVKGIARATRHEQAMRVIELVGLSGREQYFPRELSGGQQQRVGIARSLAVEPDIWFLDEPFSALDPLIRHEMQDEFLRLQSVLHKTIVFITHDFNEAIRLADRIAIMNEGEIVQLGTAEEIVTRPATPYVAEFTRNIPRENILSVRSVMDAPDPSLAPDAPSVQASDRIAAAAPLILRTDRPLAVREDGQVVGVISRQRVVETLFGDRN